MAPAKAFLNLDESIALHVHIIYDYFKPDYGSRYISSASCDYVGPTYYIMFTYWLMIRK